MNVAVDDNDSVPKYRPQNRATSDSKRRRNKRFCPVCLAELKKNARRTKLMAMCVECQAHPVPGKCCSKCGAEAIWQSKAGAACRSCGRNGPAVVVVS